jgi:hypothetical protein
MAQDIHLKLLPSVEPGPSADAISTKRGTVRSKGTWYGCQDCLKLLKSHPSTYWVHLRKCETCGHIGCCDSSPHRHARAHSHEPGHPIVRSFEPGEEWRYCFLDEREV